MKKIEKQNSATGTKWRLMETNVAGVKMQKMERLSSSACRQHWKPGSTF